MHTKWRVAMGSDICLHANLQPRNIQQIPKAPHFVQDLQLPWRKWCEKLANLLLASRALLDTCRLPLLLASFAATSYFVMVNSFPFAWRCLLLLFFLRFFVGLLHWIWRKQPKKIINGWIVARMRTLGKTTKDVHITIKIRDWFLDSLCFAKQGANWTR